MVEKQHVYSYKNLENKIGDKNVSESLILTLFVQVLQKKVPRNAKYSDVRSQVNTGKTMKQVSTISKFLYVLAHFNRVTRWLADCEEKEREVQAH